MTETFLRSQSARSLDAYYGNMSVQTPPVGRYTGRAWIIGVPLVGWLIRLVWQGKVFEGDAVTNRVLGLSLFRGLVFASKRDVVIQYKRLHLYDTLRQFGPGQYLGRMRLGKLTVHFTLTQSET